MYSVICSKHFQLEQAHQSKNELDRYMLIARYFRKQEDR